MKMTSLESVGPRLGAVGLAIIPALGSAAFSDSRDQNQGLCGPVEYKRVGAGLVHREG